MANKAASKKAIRQIARRTDANTARRSRMRTFLRRVEEAIAKGDKTAASEALQAVQPEIARAAQKSLMHRNAAARKMSRLSGRIKAIGA